MDIPDVLGVFVFSVKFSTAEDAREDPTRDTVHALNMSLHISFSFEFFVTTWDLTNHQAISLSKLFKDCTKSVGILRSRFNRCIPSQRGGAVWSRGNESSFIAPHWRLNVCRMAQTSLAMWICLEVASGRSLLLVEKNWIDLTVANL